MKNFIAFLFVFLICAIFAVLFKDIFRAEDIVKIGLKSTLATLFLIVILLITAKKFFGYFGEFVSNNATIFMLTATLLSGFFVQKFIAVEKTLEFTSLGSNKFLNPMWDEYQKIAKFYKLNLNFAKYVWQQRGPNDYMIHEIFKDKPKSIDALIFGDSSVAWGAIPQIIEQMSDKRVRIYAYESNLLNVKSVKVFEKIANYYLKDDGVLIYAFADWTQNKATDELRISKDTYDKFVNLSSEEFEKFVLNFYEKKGLIDRISLANFKKNFDEISGDLKARYEVKLISSNMYFSYLEPMINKKWHEIKTKNSNKGGGFLRFDMNVITQYNAKFTKTIDKNLEYKIEPKFSDNNTKLNSDAAKTLQAKTRVYMKPFTDRKNVFWENAYEKYYKQDGFIFVNLNKYAIETEKESGFKIVMEGGTHTGNTGGLLLSISIAKWLNEFYGKR